MIYRRKADPVRAIRLHDISISYEKWGGTQIGKMGDWLIENNEEVYTCDATVFEETYVPIDGSPGFFIKVASVEAVEATESGSIKTLEGSSEYKAGDYIVTNPAGDRYPISREKFIQLYEAE